MVCWVIEAMKRIVLTLIFLGLSSFCAAANLHSGSMVVTTHPLYLIAQAVTKGVETPTLLLNPSQSGHDIQLRPQERQLIKQSNFVLWFGERYEAPLAKLLVGQPNAIALFDLKAFQRLSMRDAQGKVLANTLDPHLWLDPVNAIAIAHAIAAVRAQQYPQFAGQYKSNAEQFSLRLIKQMAAVNKAVKRPADYWVYHDAYQYLEHTLNLRFKGALTVDHDLPPTIAQIQWLQKTRPMQYGKPAPMCLLAESQVAVSTVQRLQPAVLQPVDETMLGQQDFVTAWGILAKQIIDCTQFSR